jgi:hypothetical protein
VICSVLIGSILNTEQRSDYSTGPYRRRRVPHAVATKKRPGLWKVNLAMKLKNHPFQDYVNVKAYPVLLAFRMNGVREEWVLDARGRDITPETFPPCRKSPPFKRRRNYSGTYPFLKFQSERYQMVMFESLVELGCLMELEHSGTILSIAAQPFGLAFTDGGFHYPDFAVRTSSGKTVIIDVKPVELAMKEKFVHDVNMTRTVCQTQNWDYRVMHGPEGWEAANLEWISAFRYSEYEPSADQVIRVLQFLTSPRTMRDAAAVLDPRMELGLGYALLSNLMFHRQVVALEPGPFYPGLWISAVTVAADLGSAG